MNENQDLLKELKIPTGDLSSTILQNVLIEAQKASKTNNIANIPWDQICEVLWNHLHDGFQRLEDQLLCATCFYSSLTLCDQEVPYLKGFQKILNIEINIRENQLKNYVQTSKTISLIYGMFQSTYISHVKSKIVDKILQRSLTLLISMAYEYSQFTFIVFKIIHSFKKVIGTELESLVYNKDNQIKLLNMINHNWENPITGVRDLNKMIFQTLVTIIDEEMLTNIETAINGFGWNKAKFLMFAILAERQKYNISSFVKNNYCLEGLTYSLHKSGLVSAGADFYYAILGNINTITEWHELFFENIMKILHSSSMKAIENFNNYWLLNTLKKFPTVINLLIIELNTSESEYKMYGSLFILKQGHRLGLLDKYLEENSKDARQQVVIGIEHCDTNVRRLAFDIICISQFKSLPNGMEYNIILNYLENNVNSDCTVLRLNMINSFEAFMQHLHTAFLNLSNLDETILNLLIEFCMKLQIFIVYSLKLNGNYQRKITTIKLCYITHVCLSGVPRKKQKQVRKIENTLIEVLKSKDCWLLSDKKYLDQLISLLHDPADDIRESCVQLLLSYYYEDMRQTETLNLMIKEAMENIQNKFFYKVSCGQTMIKLVTHILIKDKHSNSIFKSVEDIYFYGCNELIAEYEMKRNIMESIEQGKQLHSLMNIIYVVLDVSLQKSYNIDISDNLLALVETLEGTASQFVWDEDSTSSDFSKMSDMVQEMITKSGYQCDTKDKSNISGLHQIILNCLWLNVKMSCDLSSLLIKYISDDKEMNQQVVQRCLNVITKVLETSRHKGAIEAAGAALGQAIQCLTTMKEDSQMVKLPNILLENKLSELISESNRMASITRRGAGLSIMIHRIVSSDMRKGKPLFHYFMDILLEVCKNAADAESSNPDAGNQKDLPKAIYIHFLTRIVLDSSLATEVMFYSAKLAELAFDNLTSPHWQIRNAALQLYGALVPKLIGQKKPSGPGDETVATVACDEFRTHSPKLWQYISNQICSVNSQNLVSHSNLIPILNILATSAKRYNFSEDTKNHTATDLKLLQNLIKLLGSPIYTVRRLTAKSIFNLFELDQIFEILLQNDLISENYIHGSLMLISICYKFYTNKDYQCDFNKIIKKYKIVLANGKHSYLTYFQFEELDKNSEIQLSELQNTISIFNNDKFASGKSLWCNLRLEKCINNSSWTHLPITLKLILTCNDYETHLKTVLKRVEKDKCPNKSILKEIADILTLFKSKFNSGVVWEILYNIAKYVDRNNVDLDSIFNNIVSNGVSYKLRYILPFIARIAAISNHNSLLELSKTILLLTDADIDLDMRSIACLANNELGNEFVKLPDKCKVTALATTVILLQDEDEDIRNLSALMYSNINKLKFTFQPFICLNKILNYNFLVNTFEDTKIAVRHLCDTIEFALKTNPNQKIDEYNPFANDAKNIYLESNSLKHMIKDLLKSCE